MKRIHPKLSHAAALAAIAVSCSAGGCRNQQGGVTNPFLAPGRVPPPATRALLPGQAQPYYPGDPLPVMQSGTGQPAASAALASAEAEQMPSAQQNLSWTSPRGAAVATAATDVVPAVAASPKPSMVASNEPTVAIPTDGDSLRFALPPPLPVEPQSFTPSGPVALATSQQALPLQPPIQPGIPPTQDVLQASYSAPVITNSEPAALSPWRTPQIAQQSAAPANYAVPMNYAPPIVAQPVSQPIAMAAPPLFSVNAMPPVPATNTMDVRLRAVASPPDAMAPNMPRIRMPGYDAAPPMIGSNDGFRPRSSMR